MKRSLAAVLIAAAAVPALQGCFPLAVTGMGAAALMAGDRRTTGIYIEDENIEWKIRGQLLRIPGGMIGSAIGRVPRGNTGGANVSAIRPLQAARTARDSGMRGRCIHRRYTHRWRWRVRFAETRCQPPGRWSGSKVLQ